MNKPSWWRPPRDCRRCHKFRPHRGKGLCVSCYDYVRRPYVPTGAGRGGPGTAKSAEAVESRLEEFADLRARHYTIAQAALRVGVSVRTGERYEARLRAEKENAA